MGTLGCFNASQASRRAPSPYRSRTPAVALHRPSIEPPGVRYRAPWTDITSARKPTAGVDRSTRTWTARDRASWAARFRSHAGPSSARTEAPVPCSNSQPANAATVRKRPALVGHPSGVHVNASSPCGPNRPVLSARTGEWPGEAEMRSATDASAARPPGCVTPLPMLRLKPTEASRARRVCTCAIALGPANRQMMKTRTPISDRKFLDVRPNG